MGSIVAARCATSASSQSPQSDEGELNPVLEDVQEPVDAPVAGDTSSDEGVDGSGDEAVSPKRPRDPAAPTEREILEHRVAHIPFRSWCPHCVAGRAPSLPHRRADLGRERALPEVCYDYWHMGEAGAPGSVVSIAGRDRDSRALFGYALPSKGVDESEYAARAILRDIEWLGHRALVLRSDQERSMGAVFARVKALREAPTHIELSPVGESQSNGRAERAVQALEQQVRVLKLNLEQRLSAEIPATHPAIAWLVQHAAFLVTRLFRRRTGRTSYELVRGRPYSSELVEFGQVVFYKKLGKPRGGDLSRRWDVGLWLGKDVRADEHVIAASSTSTIRVRSIRTLPAKDSWDLQKPE